MLKQLMHSMSMSMIRDRSVESFHERLQRSDKSAAGWLELRKGFFTKLEINGELCIAAAGVLEEAATLARLDKQSAACGRPPLEDCVRQRLEQWQLLRFDLPLQASVTVDVGAWTVDFEFVSEHQSLVDPRSPKFTKLLSSPSCPSQLLSSTLSNMRGILEGQFEYFAAVPAGALGFGLLDYHSVTADNVMLLPHSLARLDKKIREGLPLFAPIVLPFRPVEVENAVGFSIFRFNYRLQADCALK